MCEAVAAERAGGERGFLFAAQKAENRVPPSIKAASEAAAATMRLPLNAGRANVKKQYKRLFFSQTPKKGCGEKRRGFSPRDAKRPRGRFPQETGGARRGDAAP
jgi:hypothetical protein